MTFCDKMLKQKIIISIFMTFMLIISGVFSSSFTVDAATSCKSVISYPGEAKADVNMRKKAGMKYKSYGIVEKGSSITILGYVKNGGMTWYKCKAKLQTGATKTGYISSSYIKKESKPTGVVNNKVTNTLNVRKSAKKTAKAVLKIPQKTKTTVLSIKKSLGNYWYKVNVTYNGKTKTGYVLGSYIDIEAPQDTKEKDDIKTGYVNEKVTSFLNVRQSTSTSSTIVAKIPRGLEVSVVSLSGNWYKIKAVYDSKEINGYVAKEYITFGNAPADLKKESKAEEKAEQKKSNPVTNEDFAAQLAKFPESYKNYIIAMREKYPNWSFIAIDTGLDWNTAVTSEYSGKLNSIYSTYPKKGTSGAPLHYLYTPITLMDNGPYYRAAQGTIAYYMDPRNFLNETDIFQFEKLSYDTSQSSTVVESILKNTFMSGNYSVTDIATNQIVSGSYVQAFMDAGKEAGANPYFLAARCKQEVGIKGSNATSGTYKKYTGIYNYYNIGANDGGDAVAKGLEWAKGGANNATTYGRPWTTPYKSIVGGASYIAQNYIAKGQDTLYFQKFNVHPTNTKLLYSHQYMTNIQAPLSEGRSTRAAYSALGILSDSMVFYIPVFNNMPETPCELPKLGQAAQ